jgi:hypothetical protein
MQFISILLCLVLVLNSGHADDLSISFVDPSIINVDHWDGWGTTLAWWPERMKEHLSEELIDAVVQALFHV